jgi:ABC-type transport system substrate-binding protein
VTQAFEWTVFLEQFVNALEFDAVVLGWTGGDLDPDLYQIWHSSQTHPYQLNFAGYANPEADALIEEILLEYDEPRQIELAKRLHGLIAADQPYVFLFSVRSTYVLDRRLAIVERDESGAEQFRRIEAIYGRITFFFERWRKLSEDPVFAEEG